MSNTKTPGQVAHEKELSLKLLECPYGNYSTWDGLTTQSRAVYEEVAKAVIAHHNQPWSLPAPPAGREWHRNDWTAEMLPDGWRPLLKGECINPYCDVSGGPGNFTKIITNADDWVPERFPFNFYRTRRPLPPAHEVKITLPALTLTHGKHSLASQEVAV